MLKKFQLLVLRWACDNNHNTQFCYFTESLGCGLIRKKMKETEQLLPTYSPSVSPTL